MNLNLNFFWLVIVNFWFIFWTRRTSRSSFNFVYLKRNKYIIWSLKSWVYFHLGWWARLTRVLVGVNVGVNKTNFLWIFSVMFSFSARRSLNLPRLRLVVRGCCGWIELTPASTSVESTSTFSSTSSSSLKQARPLKTSHKLS